MSKIRLTESQLHRVISESVNEVLSELDWKTYANAARKEAKLGDKRTDAFIDAMRRGFNKEYGMNSFDDDDVDLRKISTDGSYEMPHIVGGRPIGNNGYYDRLVTPTEEPYYKVGPAYTRFHNIRDMFDLDLPAKYPQHSAYSVGSLRNTSVPLDMDAIEPEYTEDYMKARNKGNQEVMDYQKGNYEYQKGKGWQKKDGLDESISRAIRKVLR